MFHQTLQAYTTYEWHFLQFMHIPRTTAEIRTCNLPIANPALYHTATSAAKGTAISLCV